MTIAPAEGLDRPPRRRLLGLLAGLPFTGLPRLASNAGAATALTENLRQGATLLVAGPDGGRLDALSRLIAPPIARSLPTGTALNRTLTGGADGVTGANQFDARVAPDGLTVLMVPGAAALAWLSGDPRAQFDAARWVPVMAATTPGVLVGRDPPVRLARGTRLRIAAASPTGPEMPALLAVDLCGAVAVPVFGLADQASAHEALAQGGVDAVFVRGSDALEELAALASLHARPLFGFGVPAAEGMTRDPLLPDVPDLVEFATRLHGVPPHGPLFAAWQAAAAATRLEFALVLPQLTPAAMVALWRRAGAQTAGTPEVQRVSPSMRTVATPAANDSVSVIAARPTALLELRRWLAVRFNWRPS